MRTGYFAVCCAAVLLLMAAVNVGRAQDSLGLRCVSNIDFWQGISTLQMEGNRVYAAAGESGLHVMDLSDAAHPVELGRHPWNDWDCNEYETFVDGQRAYVCSYMAGYVLDISHPEAPVVLGQWQGYGSPFIYFVHGNLAVSYGDEGYPSFVDVSDPANVHYINGEFPGSPGPMRAMGMAGDYLCMAGYGVRLCDISDPLNLVLVSAADTVDGDWACFMYGNYVYVSTYDTVHIVDVFNPLLPHDVATLDGRWDAPATVSGTHVIMSGQGLHIYDMSDPTEPVLVNVFAPERSFGALASSGNLVCAGSDGSNAVTTIDISDPTEPVEVNSFGLNCNVSHMVVRGTVGYLGDRGAGLHTINLADPQHVSLLGSTRAYAADIAVHGNYAYTASGMYGLCIFDVSNPAQPFQVDSVYSPLTYEVYRVLTEGNYAYVSDRASAGNYAVQVFDLSDPLHPLLTHAIATSSEETVLAVSSGYLYLGTGNIAVWSLANPAIPEYVGTCPLTNGGAVKDIAFAGNNCCVADYNGGLWILDNTDPEHMAWLGHLDGMTSLVAAGGTTLFADDTTGLRVLDLSDPAHPQLVGHYATREQLRDLEVYGSHLLTASPSAFRVYQSDALSALNSRADTPHEFALHPSYPNPFNPSTVISFSLPKTQQAKLTVYDVTGRRVTVLSDGVLTAGEHRVNFDGSALSSGVYFARLEAGKNVRTQKMMLVK